MSLRSIFSYKFISFLGDEIEFLDYNNQHGIGQIIHNNISTITNDFRVYCQEHNSQKEYVILSVGPEISIGLLWNSNNTHNPYVMAYKRDANEKDRFQYASRNRTYSVPLSDIPRLHTPSFSVRVRNSLSAIIKFSHNMAEINRSDIWMQRDLQGYADKIDSYPLMAQQYDKDDDFNR